MPVSGSMSPQGEAREPEQWEELESSSIASVSFNQATFTLAVKYKNGGIWEYENISPEQYKTLKHISSAGNYLRQKIVPNHAGHKRGPSGNSDTETLRE